MGRKSVKYERILFFSFTLIIFQSVNPTCLQISNPIQQIDSNWNLPPLEVVHLGRFSTEFFKRFLQILNACDVVHFYLTLQSFTFFTDTSLGFYIILRCLGKKHNCNILFRLRSSRVKGQDRLTSDAVSLLSLHTKERERKKEFLK